MRLAMRHIILRPSMTAINMVCVASPSFELIVVMTTPKRRAVAAPIFIPMSSKSPPSAATYVRIKMVPRQKGLIVHSEYIIGCVYDSRSMIYATANPDRDCNEEVRLVLLSFDSSIRLRGLEGMKSESLTDRISFESYETEAPDSDLDWQDVHEEEKVERMKKDASLRMNDKAAGVDSTRIRLKHRANCSCEAAFTHAEKKDLSWFRNELARWSVNPSGYVLAKE